MNELLALKTYLKASIEKNGDQPLTLQHLVNIIGVIEKDELDKAQRLSKVLLITLNNAQS